MKAQYQGLLLDMRDLQDKLNDGQKALKNLSEDYMKAVNQAPQAVNQAPPAPDLFAEPAMEVDQV